MGTEPDRADDDPDHPDEGHRLPDEVEYPDDGTSTALPKRVEAWRKRSATGAILTGFALGLREVLETEKQEPSITLQTSGAPPKKLPVEADIEPGPPRASVVSVRPWLLEGDAPPEAARAAAERGEADGNRTATPARKRRRGRRR